MRRLLAMLPRGDGRLLLAYLALCLFSLALLWSVTEGLRGPYEDFDPGVPKSIFWRQIVWMMAGFLALTLASRIPLRHCENLAFPFYLVVLGILVLVMVVGPSIAGAKRWLAFGGLRFQPSEAAKVAVILVTAGLLSRHRARQQPAWTVLLSLLLMLAPALLVLRQPDLGTSLAFPLLWLGMIYWYGISGVFLLGITTPLVGGVFAFYSETVAHQAWPWAVYMLLLIGLLYVGRFRLIKSGAILVANIAIGVGVPYVWERLQTYQQERILAFVDPGRDILGSGYQAIQSKVAIGTGGIFGTHYLQGTQKGLAFLPERHTDFIFSVVGEELGLLGALLLLGLFLVIIMRAVDLAVNAPRPFPSYLAIGVATYFTFHVIVNAAITTGLLPVTGLPLPLISYGGSNVMTSAFLLGLLMNVGSRRYEA
jgi:rod shape determining protein RodA